MLVDKRILAVVPARGGSKGIPLKNIREIAGTPMIGLVGQVIQAIPSIDRAVISTDHDKIAEIAKVYGLEAPFRRPENISGDRIGDVEVLTHALLATEDDDGEQYDVIIMLQPTSPLRRAEHVITAINTLLNNAFDSVWTVSETDSKFHPLKQLVMDENARLHYYDPAGADIIARQQLSPVCHRNGVAYVLTRDCLLNQKTLMGRKCGSVLLDELCVSIDTEWDVSLVEFILSKNIK